MTVAALGITYPILSDSSRRYIRDYDVLHPDEGIARPSMFVVDHDGMVRWQDISYEPFTKPDFLLAEAKRLFGLHVDSVPSIVGTAGGE